MDWKHEVASREASPWEKTQLSTDEERQFSSWLQSTPWFGQIAARVAEENGSPIPSGAVFAEITGPESDYDYRGAWKAGVSAQPYEYDSGMMHWPSSTPEGKMLKSPSHPTAWMEHFMQQYGVDPHDVGANSYGDAVRWERFGPGMLSGHRGR